MHQLPAIEKGIAFMPAWSRSNRWLTVVLITPKKFGADREQIRLAPEEENIEARPVWKPMHLQTVFDTENPEIENKKRKTGKNHYKARIIEGAVSEDLFNRGLCLPSGTALTNNDLDRIIETIVQCRHP